MLILCAAPSLTPSVQFVVEPHGDGARANIAFRALRTATSYLKGHVHVALRLAARDDDSQLRRDRLVAHKMYGVLHKFISANYVSLLSYQEPSRLVPFPRLWVGSPDQRGARKRNH
jgi:hypothetical protein